MTIDFSKMSPERQLSYCKAQLEADKQYFKMEISDEFREEIALEDLTLQIAIEALKFRTVQEVVYDNAHQKALCPSCETDLIYDMRATGQFYCEKCGQKLEKGWRTLR